MPRKCIVPHCMSSRYSYPRTPLFSLPSNERLRAQWLSNMKLDEKQLGLCAHVSAPVVCLSHFEKQHVSECGRRHYLKKNAVPTILIPSEVKTSTSSPEQLFSSSSMSTKSTTFASNCSNSSCFEKKDTDVIEVDSQVAKAVVCGKTKEKAEMEEATNSETQGEPSNLISFDQRSGNGTSYWSVAGTLQKADEVKLKNTLTPCSKLLRFVLLSVDDKRGAAKRHISERDREEMPSLADSASYWRCDYCFGMFVSRTDLSRHQRRLHYMANGEIKYYCSRCTPCKISYFANDEEFRKHLAEDHGMRPDVRSGVMYSIDHAASNGNSGQMTTTERGKRKKQTNVEAIRKRKLVSITVNRVASGKEQAQKDGLGEMAENMTSRLVNNDGERSVKVESGCRDMDQNDNCDTMNGGILGAASAWTTVAKTELPECEMDEVGTSQMAGRFDVKTEPVDG